jgi:hypothetical protein
MFPISDKGKGMKVIRVVVLVALSIAFVNAWYVNAEEKKTASLPTPKAGSWWLYKTPNGENRIELMRIENGNFVTRQTKYGDRDVPYTNEWGTLEAPSSSSSGWLKFDPPVLIFSFPLWEGKNWKKRADWTLEIDAFKRVNGSIYVVGEAKAWETITVPAGSFEAIKVIIKLPTSTSTCWYAPQVHRSVKCDSDYPQYISELLDFKVIAE